MPFGSVDVPERVFPPTHLPGIAAGDWIELRTSYSAAMRRRVMKRALEFQFEAGGEGGAQVKTDPFAFRQAIVEEVVVAWSDDNTALTPAALEALPAELVDWIADEFERLSAGRGQEEKDRLADASSPAMGPEEATSLASSLT